MRFTKLVYQRVCHIIGSVSLEDAWKFDLWVARTNGEAYVYEEQLGDLPTRCCLEIRGVRQEAFCFQQPLLWAEVRYLHKREIPVWEFARWER